MIVTATVGPLWGSHPCTRAERKWTADGAEAQTPQGPTSLKHLKMHNRIALAASGALVCDFGDVDDGWRQNSRRRIVGRLILGGIWRR